MNLAISGAARLVKIVGRVLMRDSVDPAALDAALRAYDESGAGRGGGDPAQPRAGRRIWMTTATSTEAYARAPTRTRPGACAGPAGQVPGGAGGADG